MSAFDAHAASARGLDVRRARASLKAEITQGKHNFIGLYDQAGEPNAGVTLSGLRVEWFLRAVPGVGHTKVSRWLSELGISPRATLGGLRVRQRAALRERIQIVQRHYFAHQRGRVVVIVGPSGVGKGTIVRWITERYPDFVVSVSATTRPPRPGERDGQDYYFVTEGQFDRLIASEGLLEWATVHGTHRYGTPKAPVEDLLDQGKHVILEIDIQGMRLVKRRIDRVITVFVEPPSFQELAARLEGRGTEEPREIQRRLKTATREMKAKGECDVVIVNDVVEKAGQSIVDWVLASEKAQ